MPPKKTKTTKAPKGAATGEKAIALPDVSPNQEPPTKKVKTLKLNVGKRPVHGRPTSSGSDTIAVSRPRRVSAQTPRYEQDVEMKDADDDARAVSTAPSTPAKLSAAPSSALSSAPSSSKSESPFRDPTPDDTAYGANFAKFYINADEPEEKPPAKRRKTLPAEGPAKPSLPETAVAVKKKQPTEKPSENAPKSAPPKTTKQSNGAKPPPQPFPPHPESFQQHKGLHQHPRMPQPQRQPPPPPPQFMPMQMLPPPDPAAYGFQSINPASIIQMTVRASMSDPPDTIEQMIEKIEGLSYHLTDFGPGQRPPGPKHVSIGDGDHPLDNFLGIIDDESDESDEQQAERIRICGVSDEPLRFGIEFIMNALGSWVESRARQDWQHEVMRNGGQSVPSLNRKGPGRPKKYSETDFEGPAPLLGPGNFDYMASQEGQCIIAFQKVLDCGALQVGSVIPERLALVLCTLYKQIDKLINQNTKEKQPWQPMSYTAQINAQRQRVEEWLAQEARHQQAMAEMFAQRDRQHMQMNVPARPGSSSFPQQQHRMPPQFHGPGGQHFHPPPPPHVLASSGPPQRTQMEHGRDRLPKGPMDNLPIDLSGRIQHTPGSGTHGPAGSNGTTSAPPGPQPFPTPNHPAVTSDTRTQFSNTVGPAVKPSADGTIHQTHEWQHYNANNISIDLPKRTRSSLPVLTNNSSDALSQALGSKRRRQFQQTQLPHTDTPTTASTSPSQRQNGSTDAPSTVTHASAGFQAINKPVPRSATATPPTALNNTDNGIPGAISVRTATKTRNTRNKVGKGGKKGEVGGFPHAGAVVLDE
ncbi:hypothetical protein MBLNU230_g2388t1 [Neophaeotheca triangularis]